MIIDGTCSGCAGTMLEGEQRAAENSNHVVLRVEHESAASPRCAWLSHARHVESCAATTMCLEDDGDMAVLHKCDEKRRQQWDFKSPVV